LLWGRPQSQELGMKLARATLFVTLGSFLLFGIATAIAKDRKGHSSRQGYAAYAQQPLTSRDGADPRSGAIKDCNDKAAKIRYSDWQTWQLDAYRSCMFDHGQPE